MPTPWTKMYKTKNWERRSRANLHAHPLCAICESKGRVTVATLSHHVHPYKPGDDQLAFLGPLISVCHSCHLLLHGKPEKLPYRPDIGIDGMPSDPLHPFNVVSRKQEEQERKFKWPSTSERQQR
jgi:5-methylcytosine-specific restriction enzyme A